MENTKITPQNSIDIKNEHLKVSKQKKEEFESIVKHYLESKPYLSLDRKVNELEIRFGTNPKLSRPISKIDYDNVVKQLYACGFRAENIEGTQMLRINCEYTDQRTGITKTSHIRAEITGTDLIQEYCRTNSIQKIIPNEYLKVFIHTWKINNKDSFLNTLHGIQYKEEDKIVDTNLSFLENYNYETLLIENYETCEIRFKNLFSSLNFAPQDLQDQVRTDVGPISMHYSIFKANELKKRYEIENNITFDWVIRMRTDSDFRHESLDIKSLEHNLNIPSGEDWFDEAMNDQFAIGTSDAMDVYSNLYHNLYDLQSSKYHPETMLFHYLKNMNLNVNRIDFPVRINNGIDFRKVWYPHLVQ